VTLNYVVDPNSIFASLVAVLTGKLRTVAGILEDANSVHAKMLGEIEREREV
jgi:hypothetical protein